MVFNKRPPPAPRGPCGGPHLAYGSWCGTGRLFYALAWTIDVWWFQLTGIVQTNDLGDSINWNCPKNCFHRLSINWSCLNHWFRVMYVNWYCWDSCFWRPSINWNYPDNQVLEAILWKPAATTLQRAINWFGQYTTIPRYDCLPNRMEKFPVNPTICKVRLYYALLWVVSIQWGVSISIQLIGTRSWHFSSNWFRGRPLKLVVRTIPINFQLSKSIFRAIQFNWQHQKSNVCTAPFNK